MKVSEIWETETALLSRRTEVWLKEGRAWSIVTSLMIDVGKRAENVDRLVFSLLGEGSLALVREDILGRWVLRLEERRVGIRVRAPRCVLVSHLALAV